MLSPPILIGAPVAFLPVPMPQTLFVADALPDPTGPAAPDALAATATASKTMARLAARALPIRFLDLIPFLLD